MSCLLWRHLASSFLQRGASQHTACLSLYLNPSAALLLGFHRVGRQTGFTCCNVQHCSVWRCNISCLGIMPSAVHSRGWSTQLAGKKSHCCYHLFLTAAPPHWSFSGSCLSCYNLACWYSPTAAFLPCPCLPGMLESLDGAWGCPCSTLLKSEGGSAGPSSHLCCLQDQKSMVLDGCRCSPVGTAFSVAREEPLRCWHHDYVKGENGCCWNHATGTVAWAAPVPVGLPPAGGSPGTQWRVESGRVKSGCAEQGALCWLGWLSLVSAVTQNTRIITNVRKHSTIWAPEALGCEIAFFSFFVSGQGSCTYIKEILI